MGMLLCVSSKSWVLQRKTIASTLYQPLIPHMLILKHNAHFETISLKQHTIRM